MSDLAEPVGTLDTAVTRISVDAVLDAPPRSSKPAAPPKPDWNDEASVAFMKTKLLESGLTSEDVRAYPARYPGIHKVPGFVLQYGDESGGWRMRLARDTDKYMGPKDYVGIWFPEGQSTAPLPEQSQLYIVEGELKASKFKKQFPHLNVIGIGGCWMFRQHGLLHPALSNFITFGTRVNVLFDGDIETKLNIKLAAGTLLHILGQRGCAVAVCRPPNGKGADDWLVANPQANVRDLITVDDAAVTGLYKLAQQLGCSQTEKGAIIPNETNAMLLIQHLYEGRIINDTRLGLIIDGKCSDITSIMTELVVLFQQRISHRYKPAVIGAGLNMALPRPVDLLQELLQNVKWDGVSRLSTWGSDHIPSDIPAMANDWGRQLMTALALRIMRPGCKVDTVFWLVGEQGERKTFFFQELGKFEEYNGYYELDSFSENTAKDRAIALAQSLVVDIVEAQALTAKRSVQDAFKTFVTKLTLTFRRPYAVEQTKVPVGYVPVGTSNRADISTDNTGARRHYPLTVTGKVVPLDYATKLQILAEVLAMGIDKLIEDVGGTAWWRSRVRIEDMPESLRLANPHIKDAQVLNTTQYQATDDLTERLTRLLEDNQMPEYFGRGGRTAEVEEKNRQFFFTLRMLAIDKLSLGASEHELARQESLYRKILVGWMRNQSFKYQIEEAKISLSDSTLDKRGWGDGEIRKHGGGIDSKQAPQARGFLLRPKLE